MVVVVVKGLGKMRLGFTGTRNGMSYSQEELFELLMLRLEPTELHHGDCVGADAEAHQIFRDYYPDERIVIHPPTSEKHRAFCNQDKNTVMRKKQPYLQRDNEIVHQCDLLIGCPRSLQYAKRSGTWYTIRYADSKDVPTIILI